VPLHKVAVGVESGGSEWPAHEEAKGAAALAAFPARVTPGKERRCMSSIFPG
jgi:uncharacterized spore protein YtfJ